MGRTREFDEDAVLGDAMHAFRRKGYQGVSIRDLEEATGIAAGSIYNAFGDKAGLFEAAFAHYNQAVLGGRLDRHAPPSAGIGGVREVFRSLMHEPDGGSYGCLITNVAVELGGEGDPHPRVRDGLDLLARTFAERLASAEAGGVVTSVGDPDVTAVKLLALYQGILVLVRAGYDKGALEALVDAEFDALDASHDA